MKKESKYRSKYKVKYGYNVLDCVKILGWSRGGVWRAFQDSFKRKQMLDLVKLEERNE